MSGMILSARSGRCVLRSSLRAALLTVGMAGQAAAGEPAQVRWSELATWAAGREAVIPLEGGTKVSGRVLAVKDESLLFEIRTSSDLRRYARGEASLPRAALSEVRILEKRRKGMRVAGALIGALGGFVAAMEIGEGPMRSSSTAATYTVFFGVWGGSAVGGYYAGRAAEQQWKRVRVVP